jgi:hypothetical protein
MFTRRGFLSSITMAPILLTASRASQAQAPGLPERFEKKVLEYEAADKASPPPPGAILFAGLPDVRIAYSSFTTGAGRWDEAPQRVAANRGIQEYVATQPNLAFFDLWAAMLGA